MLRLLKSASYRTRLRLTEVLGYSGRQLQRWWATYPKGGLEALLEIGTPGGNKERNTEEALGALEREIKEGTIATLEEARRFLGERLGIHYEGVSGLSRLFERHRIKLKTGRRRRSNRASE